MCNNKVRCEVRINDNILSEGFTTDKWGHILISGGTAIIEFYKEIILKNLNLENENME